MVDFPAIHPHPAGDDVQVVIVRVLMEINDHGIGRIAHLLKPLVGERYQLLLCHRPALGAEGHMELRELEVIVTCLRVFGQIIGDGLCGQQLRVVLERAEVPHLHPLCRPLVDFLFIVLYSGKRSRGLQNLDNHKSYVLFL